MAAPYYVYCNARMPVLKAEAEARGTPLSPKELRARVSSEWKTVKATIPALTDAEKKAQKEAREARKAEKEARKAEVLNTRVDLYISYLRSVKEHNHVLYEKAKGFKTRHSNLSEHFTENTLKWHLRKEDEDVVCCRLTAKKGGDLCSTTKGMIQCKTFTSVGPISFGPTEKWDVLYFVDMMYLFTDNRIRIWHLPLANTSEAWRNIQLKKKRDDVAPVGHTIGEQAMAGRRPRIPFSALKPQVANLIELVFEGTLEDAVGLTPEEVAQARQEYDAI